MSALHGQSQKPSLQPLESIQVQYLPQKQALIIVQSLRAQEDKGSQGLPEAQIYLGEAKRYFHCGPSIQDVSAPS